MPESVRDQRHYEPASPEALEQEFPGWHVWKGVNSLWCARLLETSLSIVAERAEDLQDLRDKIISAICRRDQGPIK
jgi:phosphoenolpyruvate-protein kinase (PTS system EI component)